MDRQPFCIALTLSLAVWLGACSNSRPDSGTPTPVPGGTPVPIPAPGGGQAQPIQQLTGWVYDTAYRPLGGVAVTVLTGPSAGKSAFSSSTTGAFSIVGTFDGDNELRAALSGHVETIWKLCPSGQCSAGATAYTYVYMQLTDDPVNLAGNFTMTLEADSACTGIPEAARTRTYDATIEPSASSRVPPAQFVLTVHGAPLLLNGNSSNTMLIGVAGRMATFLIGPEGLLIVEELAKNTYLTSWGDASITLPTPVPQTVSVPFSGGVEYCEMNSAMGTFYNCLNLRPQGRCLAQNHRLTLTRR
jgi:hypothetical protein